MAADRPHARPAADQNNLTPLVIALPASGHAMAAGPPVEKHTARRTSSQVRSAVCPSLAVPNTVETRRHSDLLSRAWSGMVKRGGISRVAATSLSHYCGKLLPVI